MDVFQRALALLGEDIASQITETEMDLIPEDRYVVGGKACEFLLAGQLAQLLAIRAQALGGDITAFTSEGTSVTLAQSDLWGAASALMDMSPTRDNDQDGIAVISIGGGLDGQVNPYRIGQYVTWDGDFPVLHDWRTPDARQ